MKGFAKRLDRELNVMSNGVLSSDVGDCVGCASGSCSRRGEQDELVSRSEYPWLFGLFFG